MFTKIPESTMQYLVGEAQKGNADAYGEIYDALVTPIYRYIYYRVGNREDAEDLTEQVFLRGWERRASYTAQENLPFSAWIYRIAHNAVVDFYRQQSKKQVGELSEELVDEEGESPKGYAEKQLLKDALTMALAKLPQNYQDILVFRFINDLSTREIAGITGKSDEAIRVLQFRALKSLKKYMQAE